MNSAVILFMVLLAGAPQNQRYQPPSSIYSQDDNAPATGSANQQPGYQSSPYQTQPPEPVGSFPYIPADPEPYNGAPMDDRANPPSRVTAAQLDSPTWTRQPSDPSGSFPLSTYGSPLPHPDDVPPASIMTYTPPNYAREAARPNDLLDPPRPASDGATSYPGPLVSPPTEPTAPPASRYRDQDYNLDALIPREGQTSPPDWNPPTPSDAGFDQQPVATPSSATMPIPAVPVQRPVDDGLVRQPATIPPARNLTQFEEAQAAAQRPVDPPVTYTTPAQGPAYPRPAYLDEELPSAIPAAAPTNSYLFTLLILFGSIGLNMYLGWVSWDTYNRYQDLVRDIRYTSPRRAPARSRESATDSRLADGAAF